MCAWEEACLKQVVERMESPPTQDGEKHYKSKQDFHLVQKDMATSM